MSESLAVGNLQAWYGESKVLHGMDFSVRTGEVVTLLGRVVEEIPGAEFEGRSGALKSYLGL